MREPRKTLAGTQAEGQLYRDFWRIYVAARLRGGNDEQFVYAEEIFEQTTLENCEQC